MTHETLEKRDFSPINDMIVDDSSNNSAQVNLEKRLSSNPLHQASDKSNSFIA